MTEYQPPQHRPTPYQRPQVPPGSSAPQQPWSGTEPAALIASQPYNSAEQSYYGQAPYGAPHHIQEAPFAPPPTVGTPATVSVRKAWLWAGLTAGVVLVAVAGTVGFVLGHGSGAAAAAAASSSAQDVRLSKAFNACKSEDDAHTMQLGDGGRTIIVDTRNEYTSTQGVECVWSELKTPQSIVANVGATTAMMGEQSAQSDGISYRWSYHPDNGLNMVITTNPQ